MSTAHITILGNSCPVDLAAIRREVEQMYAMGIADGRAAAGRYASTAERQYGLNHYASRGRLSYASYERGVHDGIEQVMRELGEL